MAAAEFTGFWLGVLLPLVYLPLLLSGFPTPTTTGAFLGLICLHVLALRVGSGYDPN